MPTVDVSSFQRFADALRAAGATAQPKMAAGLRTAAEGMAAKIRSSTSYSVRIPPATSVIPYPTGAAVRVDGKAAPNASPIENHGKGFVRHPIFVPEAQMPGPSGSWTGKHSHPAFFTPAFAEAVESAEGELTDVVEEIFGQVIAGSE
jgi:hypothetical protein